MKERLEKLLEKACACFDEAEVFYLSSESTSLRVYEGETEEFSIASTGVCLCEQNRRERPAWLTVSLWKKSIFLN